MAPASSWGNTARSRHELLELDDRSAPFPPLPLHSTFLPFGNGRSYGDSCLNDGGVLVRTRRADRFISFDRERGTLHCEAGVLLDEILDLIVPAGWFLAVTPGTRLVTVGGAIANDVHGKNHHRTGTFGRHVQHLELLRSDQTRITCSPRDNPTWFAATVAGLGLTGIITAAQIALRPIAGPWIDLETIRFRNLDQFLQLTRDSDAGYEYTVAWIDCRDGVGRGLFQRGNHAAQAGSPDRRQRPWNVPFRAPISAVNAATAGLFSTAHYWRQRCDRQRSRVHYESFFYPLDGILNWNRLYGPRGFYQYQCVIPTAAATEALQQLLQAIACSGAPTFLSVLKAFGSIESPGMLSFPAPGLTLAVDLPADPVRSAALFATLDDIIAQAGGRLYPAKDARMPGALFRSGYPRLREFSQFIDPRSSSSFWRRVVGEGCEGTHSRVAAQVSAPAAPPATSAA